MQAVEKFDTLMSRTYHMEYKPSDDPINPFVQIVEHKLRPRLEEVHLRNRYRRTLSALLASKPLPDTQVKTHGVLNTLHRYENGLQGKVSLAAPTKEHQKYAALRKGRDPRMNEPNAHFDKLGKENQGFNVGRHEGQRPTSATLAWRPRNPFLTYEKATLTDAQLQEMDSKKLHSTIMNDRVQIYNQQFVDDELLPSQCGWKKGGKEERQLRWSTLEYPVMPPNQHCINNLNSVKQQKLEAAKKANERNEESPDQNNEEKPEGVQEQDKAPERLNLEPPNKPGELAQDDKMPAQILEEMRKSNIKDIIRNMTVHEQLRMLRNLMDDEEFKRREKLRSERNSREQEAAQARKDQAKEITAAVMKQQQSPVAAQRAAFTAKPRRHLNQDLLQMEQGQDKEEQPAQAKKSKKRLDDMTYQELVNQKPSDVLEAEEVDCDGPLPLTEHNVSAMNNNSETRDWQVVSAVRPRYSQSPHRETPDERERADIFRQQQRHSRDVKFKNTAIDIKKVNEKKEADRLLQQGWQQPKQMDPEEIRRRQAGAAAIADERSNSAMAKRVYEIVKRNGIVDTTIPPVPRLVMGNHAQQV